VPEGGDLVITREAPMGEVCQIPPNLKCCLGQRQVLLRPNPHKVDGRFLLYALQSPYVQHQIGWSEGTGSTVSNIRIPVLEALRVPTPDLRTQREIAGILGALDNRITLLRETNATLEAIAQALYKSWFVDFDPVRAKMEGRAPEGMDEATAALFPSNLQESELGGNPPRVARDRFR
jgi:type I restriction enzyme S subunit